MKKIVWCCLFGFLVLTGCETEAQRKARMEQIAEDNRQRELESERRRIESEKRAADEAAELARQSRERKAREERARKERKRRARLLATHLPNGAQPFATCWGWNQSCETRGCSEIVVIADRNYDVLITIKEDNRWGDVVRHAYVRAGGRKTFEMPNGTYQPFFTYGKGWDEDEKSPIKGCSKRGWFVEQLDPSKHDPVRLSNDVLTYTLQVSTGGNFSTRPSNDAEAF